MTTPAINRSGALYADIVSEYVFKSGQIDRYVLGQQYSKRVAEARPQSVNSPRHPISGWRNPAGFSHTGFAATYPTGEVAWPQPSQSIFSHIVKAYGFQDVASGVPAYPDQSVVNRAIEKALDKIKNQKVNLAQMVLEAGETTELIVSTVHKVTNLAKAFRSKNPKAFLWGKTIGNQPGHRGRKAPEAYLEFMYGAKPLYGDAYGILDELQNLGETRPPAFTCTGKATRKDGGVRYLPNAWDSDFKCVSEWNQTESVKVRIDLELVNPFTASLSATGILNPAALFWERLPLSFLVDWFAPVGHWLGNLDAGTGCSFKGGSISLITRRSERSTGFTSSTNAYYSGPGYRYDGYAFRRDVLDSIPLGGIYLKNPFPKNGVHVANAVALLASALR